jgi:hypothetical protein
MDYKPEDQLRSSSPLQMKQAAEERRESGCDTPVYGSSSAATSVKTEMPTAYTGTTLEFRVADSLRDSFSDPAQFQLFKHVLEGVNKNTTKRMLGEAMGAGMGGLLQEDEPYYEDSLNSEDGGGGAGGSLLNNSRGRTSDEGEEERKVRVRTLISEEQQLVLKTHYARNAKPKKEILLEIAATIGHPFRVVKVWFQNMRARDRREGKHHHPHPALGPPGAGVIGGPTLSGQRPPFNSSLPLNSSAAAAAAAFLNNNVHSFPLPPHHQQRPLHLPLLRPPGSGPPLANHPLFAFPPFGFFESHHGAANKSPGSSGSCHSEDNIEDEMEEEEEEEEEDDEEQESAPLDLSNKGSTPGASPPTDREEVGLTEPLKLNIGENGDERSACRLLSSSSSCSSSSDEESGSSQGGGGDVGPFPPTPCPQCSKIFTKRSSLSRHVHDHSGKSKRIFFQFEQYYNNLKFEAGYVKLELFIN